MEPKKPFDHNFQYLDLPGVPEIFVDGIHVTTAGNTVARMTLTVSRPDAPKPGNKTPTGKKVTAVRLAMPTPAFVEIYNQMHQLMGALEQTGLVRRDGAHITSTMQ